ncbi:type II toxin-antitoxin system RelE/ParE family toxin [Flavobacterium sp. UBA6195]|uniref:type II toxin-antitoxin system RelE/ParE family toxin n=1 Tax=Flavobacterium sp. UBA6195 TaxID=1946554 RepID=UPI0025BE75A4|nr:type II toxin-antitoxin system RelE/ParE family toxin [Flavobacterium sp. UBA6195]
MNSYILTKDAEEDLDRIHEFGVYKFGMQQADKYYELLFDSFERIAKNPYMFPTAAHLDKKYRYCVCKADVIYYKILNDNLVEIITIIGRQDF